MSLYKNKPDRFFSDLLGSDSPLGARVYCAGFESGEWRRDQYAEHVMEWLPDYALAEEELSVNHGNIYVRLKQAAVRVYTSEKYKKRGELGEISIHAICRDFYDTIPISNRVFYKSASNDVVKAFDMVHARVIDGEPVQIWLGESKLWKDRQDAVQDAIKSMRSHLAAGFLKSEKLLLGPQIPKTTPRYDEIMHFFKPQTSLDELLGNAVFPVLVAANSQAVISAKTGDEEYKSSIKKEVEEILAAVSNAKDLAGLKILVISVPVADKDALLDAFDLKLKGLQS